METENFCKRLPKIELHAHLNGSLSAASLQKLNCLPKDIVKYQKLINVLPTEKSLEECFSMFKMAHDAVNNKQSVYLATKYVIEDFYNDNVVYLELRTTPRSEENMTKVDYIESVVKAIQDCKESIIVKLLLSIDRRHDLKASQQNMELIINMKNQYPHIIKGVDFSGSPLVGSFNSNLFKQAIDNGLLVTLHCGEVKNVEEIKQILQFRPNRIGHGTCIHPNYGGSEEIWELYCTTNIPLECCLTSNVVCGTAKNYETHHLQEWIKNALPFTLSTDDKGVFGTNLSKELRLAVQHLNLTHEDLWKITFDSINYTFATEEEKTILKRILQEWKLTNHF
jgi:adenosine deaminase